MRTAALSRLTAIRSRALDATIAASDRGGAFSVTTRTLRLFLQSMMLGLGAWLAIQGTVAENISRLDLKPDAGALTEASAGRAAWVERTSGEAVAWLSEQELAPARLRAFLSGIVEDVPREEASSLPERDASPVRSTHAGELAISAGMPAEIHLRTGERSPLSYFLKPLTDYFSRALREE